MLKLLVIEDHALVREGLVRLLAQIGEDKVLVLDRPDFESALELLESEDEFDLILLDLACRGSTDLPASTSCAGSSRPFPSPSCRHSTICRR